MEKLTGRLRFKHKLNLIADEQSVLHPDPFVLNVTVIALPYQLVLVRVDEVLRELKVDSEATIAHKPETETLNRQIGHRRSHKSGHTWVGSVCEESHVAVGGFCRVISLGLGVRVGGEHILEAIVWWITTRSGPATVARLKVTNTCWTLSIAQ